MIPIQEKKKLVKDQGKDPVTEDTVQVVVVLVISDLPLRILKVALPRRRLSKKTPKLRCVSWPQYATNEYLSAHWYAEMRLCLLVLLHAQKAAHAKRLAEEQKNKQAHSYGRGGA